jgi:hypothetical protein
MIKAREEWLNKPTTVPNIAAYLNLNTKTNTTTNIKTTAK